MAAKVTMREPRGDARVETPTEQIVKASQQATVIEDVRGRKLTVRRMNALDRLRMFETIGGDLVANQAYFSYVMLAGSVVAIDGEPSPPLLTKRAVEAKVGELGDEGLDAVTAFFTSSSDGKG